jgi:exonuclease III
MKLVFWNIRKQDDVKPVVDLIDKVRPDLLFLTECTDTAISSLRKQGCLFVNSPPVINTKVKCFNVSQRVACHCIMEAGERLTFYRVEFTSLNCVIGALHLISKNHAGETFQLTESLRHIQSINQMESDNGQNTIMIGDFNMNPFDAGMVVPQAFNSVCSPDIAGKMTRTVQQKKYGYFFNPSWKVFGGDEQGVYGSYYFSSPGGDRSFHWNNFDQALIRPQLLTEYDCDFQLLHPFVEFDITRKNKYSDHYPFMLELRSKK